MSAADNIVGLHGVARARTSPAERALAAQLLSDRHRLWGYHCPAFDLDFVNYDLGQPNALIEYKHENGRRLDLAKEQAPFRPLGVLRRLADACALPLFICRYAADFTRFKVRALNDRAKAILPAQTEFDEVGYVHFLYALGPRKRHLPKQVRDYLKGQGRLAFDE